MIYSVFLLTPSKRPIQFMIKLLGMSHVQAAKRDVLLYLRTKRENNNLMFQFPITTGLHWTSYFWAINNL